MFRFLLMMLVSLPAWAASRVVVTTSEPVQLFVDGMLIPTSVGNIRSAIPHVTAGPHKLAIHDLQGTYLHSETIEVPDGADVRVQWSRGANFVVSGNTPPSAVAGAAGSTPASSAAGLDTPSGVSSGTPAHLRPTSSGNLGTHSGPRPSDIMQGGGGSSGRTGVLQRAAQGASPTSIVTGAAISGVQSLTYGAQAGTNFGADAPARQKIVKPNMVYGQIVFRKLDGDGMRVYADGMLVAQLPAGAADLKAKIEVGRRTLEFRSTVDNRVMYTGDLQVDQSHTIQLAVGENSEPRPIVRPWLYKPL